MLLLRRVWDTWLDLFVDLSIPLTQSLSFRQTYLQQQVRDVRTLLDLSQEGALQDTDCGADNKLERSEATSKLHILRLAT